MKQSGEWAYGLVVEVPSGTVPTRVQTPGDRTFF
jgi:hypothetical protein